LIKRDEIVANRCVMTDRCVSLWISCALMVWLGARPVCRGDRRPPAGLAREH